MVATVLPAFVMFLLWLSVLFINVPLGSAQTQLSSVYQLLKVNPTCASEEKLFKFFYQFVLQEFYDANVNLIYDSTDILCEHVRERLHRDVGKVTSATVTIYNPEEVDVTEGKKEMIGKHFHRFTTWIELNIVIFFDGNHANNTLESLIVLHDFQRQNSFNIFWQRENRNDDFLQISALDRLKYKIEVITNKVTKKDIDVDIMSRCFYCDSGSPLNKYISNVQIDMHGALVCPTKAELFQDYTKNFYGKVFQVALARGIPSMMGYRRLKNGRIETNGGFQTQLFHMVQRKLNFQYNVTLEKSFGVEGPDGIFSGMVGAVQTGRADLGVGAAATLGRHRVVHYLTPNTFHLVTFITANPQPRPEWETIFLAFTIHLWFSFICVAVFLVYPTFVLASTFTQKDPQDFLTILINGVGYIYRAIFDQRWNRDKALKYYSIRLLSVFWLIGVLILGTEFKCNLMKLTVSPPLEQLPRSFNQLANSDYSIITHYAGGSLDRIVRTTHSATFDKITQKMKTEMSITKCLEETLKGRTACITYEDDAIIEGQKNFSDPFGHLFIHKAPISAFNFYASIILPREAVYIESMESTVSQIVDMGITKRFHDEQYDTSKMKGRRWAKRRKNQIPVYFDCYHHYEKLTVYHFMGTFLILFLGFTTAVGSWLVERRGNNEVVVINRRHRRVSVCEEE
ncbi:unnamed protein product [Allacma fusca]|uniref:Ionotropic glutamate receptor L-glutamate and glycine-binding domain-containing protein n=1 Tax=Allacma fusca TaxID=39272 RepID=A0A8J2L1T2_9HEXA|nr:unnamed protein product [Allacma fusca]